MNGCRVFDDMDSTCAAGLFLDEHVLSADGRWIHPNEIEDTK